MNDIDDKLDNYERWMVESNLKHSETVRIEVVIARLRLNGYNRVADAVIAEYNKQVANNQE